MAGDEGMDGEAVSAEELFEQRKAEIDAAFEEKGFFRRFSEMVAGLSKPRNSPDYKLARTELQRLAAPILAVVLPVMGVIVLIVVTAVTGQVQETITVDIASAIEEEAPLEEDQDIEEDVEPPPPDEYVDIQVDTPQVGPVSAMVAPSAAPAAPGPVSVKPATQDSVALIKSPVQMRSMTGSRSPGSIGRMTRGGAGYGDATTEAAVMKALRWLKYTQKPNGAWRDNPPPAGNSDNQVSNTALAILAFLAHGETPGSKEFGPTVERAMQFLIDSLTTKKDVTGKEVVSFKGVDQNEYATLIATYALCEAYGMTRNPNTKTVAMKTLQRIVDNQSPTGGWDYKLNKNSTRDDISFAGWALQALKAGKMAGLKPDGLDECIKKAVKCMKTRNFNNGSFHYTADANYHRGLTATGCLAMQLLGYMNEEEVKASLETMRKWKPSFEGAPRGTKLTDGLPNDSPQYYCYYASQCKYQAGMCQGATPANVKAWQEWNAEMKKLYPKTINTLQETIPGVDGKPKAMGYWTFKDSLCGGEKGKTMATCLAALQMMVYYRYLPTTQTKAAQVDSDSAKESGKSKKADVDIEVDI